MTKRIGYCSIGISICIFVLSVITYWKRDNIDEIAVDNGWVSWLNFRYPEAKIITTASINKKLLEYVEDNSNGNEIITYRNKIICEAYKSHITLVKHQKFYSILSKPEKKEVLQRKINIIAAKICTARKTLKEYNDYVESVATNIFCDKENSDKIIQNTIEESKKCLDKIKKINAGIEKEIQRNSK